MHFIKLHPSTFWITYRHFAFGQIYRFSVIMAWFSMPFMYSGGKSINLTLAFAFVPLVPAQEANFLAAVADLLRDARVLHSDEEGAVRPRAKSGVN